MSIFNTKNRQPRDWGKMYVGKKRKGRGNFFFINVFILYSFEYFCKTILSTLDIGSGDTRKEKLN
jgi:hypothetical protein